MRISFNSLLIICSLFIVSLTLSFIWFPARTFIAGGDVGIPMLLPAKQLQEVASSWWPSHSTGFLSPVTYTAVPFYAMLSVLNLIGLPSDVLQKLFVFLILFIGSVSVYCILLESSFSNVYSAAGAFFYIFNLTSLTVWQRGIHNGMLMLLFMPASLLLLIRGLKQQSYTHIIYLCLLSFFCSYIFGALGYIVTFWLLWIVYIFSLVTLHWNNVKKRTFLLAFLALLIIFWFITNAWWIAFMIVSSRYLFGAFSSTVIQNSTANVLEGLQVQTSPQFIIRGLSQFYLYQVKDWGLIYLSPLFIFLSWLPAIIGMMSTFNKENYTKSLWRSLIILLTLVLLISKGVNPPFGTINKLFFDYLPILAPLRDPYEKVGIMLALLFSLLLPYGFMQLANVLKRISSKLSFIVIPLILVCCLVLLVWPEWTGKLFASQGRKYVVSFPQYYFQANIWLSQHNNDSRILNLPLAPAEAVDYYWGYTGIEPSQYIFSGSSIGYMLGLPDVDQVTYALLVSIHNHDTKNIENELRFLNIGWIVVHNETLWRDRGLEPVDSINSWLATKPPFLHPVKDFGPLAIWEVDKSYQYGHIYTPSKIVQFTQAGTLHGGDILNYIDRSSESFVLDSTNSQSIDNIEQYSYRTVVAPTNVIENDFQTAHIYKENAMKELPYVKHLPGSKFYFITLLREQLQGMIDKKNGPKNCIDNSSKRLVESVLLDQQGKITEAKDNLTRYRASLADCEKMTSPTLQSYISDDLGRRIVADNLKRQLEVLITNFRHDNSNSAVSLSEIYLLHYMSNIGITSRYVPFKISENKQSYIFQYAVVKEGTYSIQLAHINSSIIAANPVITRVDGQSVSLANRISGSYLSFGKMYLTSGYHEIEIQMKPWTTLPMDADTSLETENKNSYNNVFLNINNLDSQQEYALRFNYLVTCGAAPSVQITENTAHFDEEGNQLPVIFQVMSKPKHNNEWKGATVYYTPSLNAQFATAAIYTSRCLRSSSESTGTEIKNINLVKSFNNQLLLVMEQPPHIPLHQTPISTTILSSTDYRLSFSTQKVPYLLIFSETSHPLWQMQDEQGHVLSYDHITINGYANGWLINKPLPHTVHIRFALEGIEDAAVVISIIFTGLLIPLLIYLDRKRSS